MRKHLWGAGLVRKATLGLVVAAMAVVALAVTGVASAKSSACSGTPIVIETITNISNAAGAQQAPELVSGAKAAAAALTKSCQLKAPVKVISCDDKFNPNDAAACGRDAVANKAIGVITYSGFGDSFIPTIAAAGIPIMPANATSAQENTNPLSYAFGYPIASLIGQINIAASTGRKKIALAVIDLPSVQFFVGLTQKFAKGLNVEIVKNIAVAPTATDMSGYAGQVIASGADTLITIMGPNQQLPLFQAVRQQGAGPDKIRFVASLLTMSPKNIKTLGATSKGVLLSSWGWPTTDTSKPFIKQFISELTAAGQPHGTLDLDMIGQTGWGTVHSLADALTAQKLAPTAANAPKALEMKGFGKISQKYGLNPLDFTTKAFATDPVLGGLRIFSSYQAVSEVNAKLSPVPLSPKWLGVKHVQKLKTLAG